VGEPVIGELLKKMDVGFPFTVESAMRKDSLEMTDEDRALIHRLASKCEEECVLITHGTDGMVTTAAALRGVKKKTHRTHWRPVTRRLQWKRCDI
jgi:L-asparaginase